jgi:hypothetical protein
MWDYVVIDVEGGTNEALQLRLQDLGREGWELVAVTGNNTHRAFLKREVDRCHR